jgi:hypothetical protein
MLSQLYDEYDITQKLALSKMSPDQVRKWKAAKKRASGSVIRPCINYPRAFYLRA